MKWMGLLLVLGCVRAMALPPPDPWVTFEGKVVEGVEGWKAVRVPELRRAFQEEMYGVLPQAPEKWTVVCRYENREWMGGKAVLKELEYRTAEPTACVRLLLVFPMESKGPWPVFLGMNFKGNHAVVADEGVAIPEGLEEKERERGADRKAWPIEQIVGRGYAFATFFSGDVVRDKPEVALARVKEFRAPEGVVEDSRAATLACWAWGFSRMVDVLGRQPEVDAKRVAVVGHSRNGKACLLAGALDERIAVVIPSQAGCGGTGPSRLPVQEVNPKTGRPPFETVEQITRRFPHWFCGKFNQVGANTDALKFDQNLLLALCAPRPVLVSAAVADTWSNPEGQWQMTCAADSVYQRLCGEGLAVKEMPSPGRLVPSRLAYFIRPGGHSMIEEDWVAWLDYADRWLREKSR